MLGDPGADSGGKGKSKQAVKMAQRKVILRVIFFFGPFRLSLAPTICPWVFEDDFRTAHRFIMHIRVRNYCICNKYMGLYRNLTATCSHIGMSYRGQESNFECCLNYSLSCSQGVEILGLCYTWHYNMTQNFQSSKCSFTQCARLHGHKYTFNHSS